MNGQPVWLASISRERSSGSRLYVPEWSASQRRDADARLWRLICERLAVLHAELERLKAAPARAAEWQPREHHMKLNVAFRRLGVTAPRKTRVQLALAASSSSLSSSCDVYATAEMTCPLCGILVPAKTLHRCGNTTKSGASALIAALARAAESETNR
jgi:hypothetical protein